MAKKILLSWSSGKDSAWTLYNLQQSREYEVIGLVTTVNRTHNRVAMHGVRDELLKLQAEAADLPLTMLDIPSPCSNKEYETVMQAFIDKITADGIKYMAFGDLYLQDIRDYRVKQLEGTGITPVFPLWQQPTRQLAESMINAGLETTLTCVDPRVMPAEFAGRQFDHQLLAELPESIDPCGENGEFHSCVTAGPMFKQAITVNHGEVVERDGFVFADLIPA